MKDLSFQRGKSELIRRVMDSIGQVMEFDNGSVTPLAFLPAVDMYAISPNWAHGHWLTEKKIVDRFPVLNTADLQTAQWHSRWLAARDKADALEDLLYGTTVSVVPYPPPPRYLLS
jgi:hypothetical protein